MSSHQSPPSSEKVNAAGMLMSIVQTLSSSADVKQREEQKLRLEKAFLESDRRLDNLVADHLQDLTSIIQAFSKISSRITTSQERIRAIKDNLQSCKNLLHCKRDELRKLWIEGVESKTIFAMLDEIEQVKSVADKLQSYSQKKHYLHCTDLIVSSLAVLEGDLVDVEALREIKIELVAKKEELYETLIDELHKQIYIKSTSSVVKGFQRQGSQRQSQNRDKASYYRLIQKNQTSLGVPDDAQTTSEETALKCIMDANLAEIIAPHQVREELDLDPELDPVSFIAILVESLAMLKRLPEAIDALRSRIRPGLLAIVQRASQQVADNAYLEGENISQLQQPQYLLELLELVFKQFRVVARVHSVVLANMQRIKNSMSSLGDFCLYDSVEVWNKIQAVIQYLLSDYLDIRNTATSQSQQTTTLEDASVDISSYFAKKKPVKPKKFALFRFESSSHAISMNSYMREQRQEYYGAGDVLGGGDVMSENNAGKILFVCRLCSSNITTIYNPLQKFLVEIEQATNVQPGSLSLQVFIKEFIEKIYLGQVLYNIESSIYNATKGFDTQRSLIDLHTQRDLAIPKPLLRSTMIVTRNVQELCSIMVDLPDYADQFINMICKILQDYLDSCQSSYRDYVTPDPDEKRIISATWVKDNDINRFLRSLPNWQSLKEESTAEHSMSEEDMRSMNFKESSILTSNLSSSESLIPHSEMINDVSQLRTLGNLCESLEWFTMRIHDLANSLQSGRHVFILTPPDGSTPVTWPAGLSVSDSTIVTLHSLATHFQDLSELCLLVLHLEVRVHCFHHLLQISKQNAEYHGVIDKMEPDENVTRLNKDLGSIEEVMQQSLQTNKFKYVFEGLGHLVSTILINAAQFLRRINENGIKKMCRNIFAIQQCLTNITTNRESDLDHARQYYELLYLSADDILKAIIDRGRLFTEQEYTILLNLSHRSEYGATEPDLTRRLNKLRTILTQYQL